MRFEYDKDADALDITLSVGIVARTVEIDSGTLVDLDESGNIIAIEVVRPMRPWPLEEVLEQFGIDDDDVAVLRALWNENSRYPFAEPVPLAVA